MDRRHQKGDRALSDNKWDVKHGLGKRGTDYSTGGGAIHGGSSLAQKQITGRIFELFGKTEHTADQRRMGIPTHFDQLQGLLKNLARDVGGAARSIEDQIKKDIIKAITRRTSTSRHSVLCCLHR